MDFLFEEDSENQGSEHKEYIDFLVVDDQDPMLQAIRDILKRSLPRCEVTLATNGAIALEHIKAFNVDFVVSDWNMPVMTGIEMLSLIRQNPYHHEIPVMIVSDEISKPKFIYAMEQGADSYQVKPFTELKFVEAVRSVIRSRESETSLVKMIRKIRLLIIKKKFDEALILADYVLRENKSLEISLLLATAYFNKKNYKKSRKILTSLIKEKTNSKAYHLLGLIDFEEKKYNEALANLKQACEGSPLDSKRKLDAGRVYLSLGMEEEAVDVFNAVIQEGGATDILLVGIGSSYLEKNNLEKAGEYIDRIERPIPETIDVINKYAIELRKSGNYKKGIVHYRKCLKVDPVNESYLFNIARCYFEMEDYQGAKRSLRNLLNVNPDHEYANKLLKFIHKKS